MINSITPFWNSKSDTLSKSIWNPEDYKDEFIESKDLYMTKTSHPFYSNQYIKSEESEILNEEIILSRKIRFYPTKEQKSLFNIYFSAHRYFYNKTIEKINTQYDKRKQEFSSHPTCIFCPELKQDNSFSCQLHKKNTIPWNVNVGFFDFRTEIVKTKQKLKLSENKDELWQLDIPSATKQLAIKDAITSYKSAMTNKRRGNIKNFCLGYMSKKKPTQIFWIPKTSVSVKNGEVKIFKNLLKDNSVININRKQKNKVPIKNASAVKVLYDRGAWYLIFSVNEKSETLSQKCDNLHSIALDPGVRTFQTGYSPNGSVFKFGEQQLSEMKRIHNKVDMLKSVSSNSNYKKRYHIKKRLAKLELKLRGVIHNLHNQVGSFLSRNYRYILLPEFGTSKLQESDNLQSITKRRMNGLAHYKFQLKMEHFCRKYGSELRIVDESYTSKTCGNCGNVKDDLGSACHYKCDNCSYSLDRDIHGARNIFIKTYSLN